MTDPHQQLEDIDSIITEAAHFIHAVAPMQCRRYGIGVDYYEDIEQEALYQLYRALRRKSPEERSDLYLRAYMAAIVRNICFDFIREQRKRDTSSFENLLAQGYDVQEADISSPEHLAEAAETRRELLQLISQLPGTYGAVAALYFLEGQTVREIAERLGLSINTVKSQVRRCKQKLSDQALLTRHSGGK